MTSDDPTRNGPAPATEDLAAGARRLAANWERRARSDFRDYYVASHPGWDRQDVWSRQAEIDAQMLLHGLDPGAIAGWDVLEIGCGVGRLVTPLTARVGSYSGFDIAPGMVESARERNAGVDAARFAVSDGTGIPTELDDRKYDLVFAWAVFIHCPREVVAANLRSGYAALKPGGQLRFQVRADPSDHEGLQSLEAAAALHAQMDDVQATRTPDQKDLMEEGEYMGHAFRYAELGPWLTELTGGAVTLVRVDLASLYGWIAKPPA